MIVAPRRYVLIYLATIAALIGLALVMVYGLGLSPPNGLSVLLPPVTGATLEGQRLARSGIAAIDPTDAWRAAWVTSAIALGFDLVALAVAYFAMPAVRDLLTALSPALFSFSAVTLALLVLLSNRYGLTFAFRTERNRRAGR